MTAAPCDTAETQRRIALAQIEAVFGAVPVGVSAAALASVVLAAALWSFGYTDERAGVLWSLAIVGCSLCHLVLYRAYRKARPDRDQWRVWAFWFSVISFGEGVSLGMGSNRVGGWRPV
jgi:hypothetical protein